VGTVVGKRGWKNENNKKHKFGHYFLETMQRTAKLEIMEITEITGVTGCHEATNSKWGE